MRWEDFRPSDNVIDLRLDEKSTPYRRSVVELTEAISGLGYVVMKLERDQVCPGVLQSRPEIKRLWNSLQEKEPTKDLPSEADLNFDSKLQETVLATDACSSSFSGLIRVVGEKQARVREAAQALQRHYESDYRRALKLREAIQAQKNYRGCKIPKKEERGVYGKGVRREHPKALTANAESPTNGNDDNLIMGPGLGVYQHFVWSGPNQFANAFEGVVRTLQAKKVYLGNVEAELKRASTLSGGGMRCGSVR